MIPGVGKKKAEELLKAFGSIQGVRAASQEQLAAQVGTSTAAKILDYFMNYQKKLPAARSKLFM